MTTATLAAICCGFIVNALTFVLGVMVGVALTSRKESKNDNSNEGPKKDAAYWHTVERR